MTTPYKIFADQLVIAYDNHDASLHSLSLCYHMMEIDPSDRSILDYENAIQSEKSARAKIGEINNAEMSAREKDASFSCLIS
jgi:hypothetical protein